MPITKLTFNATTTWVVPEAVYSVLVDAYGAAGSNGATAPGGKGGRATGTLAVTPGETLTITAGLRSAAGSAGRAIAADVRQGGTDLASRKIVAGAGGDGGNGGGVSGGAGGGLVGGAAGAVGETPAGGGTQSAGGAAGGGAYGVGHPGALGLGGAGADADGGNGYYGGGGGGSDYNSGGGGGGSSYLGGVTGGSTTSGVNAGAAYVTFTFDPNAAPNAPTLTSPAYNATIARAQTQRFAWLSSDPNTGDSQSAADLPYRIIGASAWTTVSITGPSGFLDLAAGTLAAGNYEWQVRTYDSFGVVGPYCSSGFFTAGDTPAGPVITSPTNGSTVSNTADITWSTAGGEDAYELRRVADNAGAADATTIYFDTGEVTSPATRTLTVAFDTNNRTEHVQVRTKLAGIWSPWADARYPVSYTAPMVPTVRLMPNNDDATMVVGITNPAPGDGVPAAAYNNVWVTDLGDSEIRKATMLPTNAVWTYALPPSGFDGVTVGLVRVETVAVNGISSWSS